MTSASETVASALAHELATLRRALRRRTQTAVGGPGLSQAEAELLRVVASRPGVRVGDAATALRLAPNTVSTLVRRLVSLDLLEAARDDDDRRAISLGVTRSGQKRLARWRDERTQLLATALDELSERDRQSLVRALPVLARLGSLLEESDEA